MLSAMQEIFITHGIKGYPNHFFTADSLVYQKSYCPRKRTMPSKVLSKIKIGRCRGFKIDSQFKSLSSLEAKKYPIPVQILVIKQESNECPF